MISIFSFVSILCSLMLVVFWFSPPMLKELKTLSRGGRLATTLFMTSIVVGMLYMSYDFDTRILPDIQSNYEQKLQRVSKTYCFNY